MSHSTAAGCQNAPTRFLPSGRLAPVLPPIAASIWPNRVVGTCTTATPVVDGGGEAGQVGHHFADRHHHVVAGEPPGGPVTAQVLDGAQVLGLLTGGEREHPAVDAGVDRQVDAGLRHDGRPLGPGREHLEQAVARPGPTSTG